ncbi:MAG: cell division protein FtsH [Desulfobulbaceae bacterium A2]|nr:MAG: cell division protein FtsH [Desulfobulbaceae bacterium A2]
MEKTVRNGILGFVAVVCLVMAYNIWQRESAPPRLEYSAFLARLQENDIARVRMEGAKLTVFDKQGQIYATTVPDPSHILPRLEELGISISAVEPRVSSDFLTTTLPILLLMIGMTWFMRRSQQGFDSQGFAKKKAIMTADKMQDIGFDNIAGIPEAKEELVEIVDYLRNPDKFTRLGGRMPKGVLLQGPPGTGKTLLAKAIAGEAGVPFYSISGSDFVEVFVGVGAQRVRELFEQAKKNSPCIIFIDEIDAVGRRRSGGQAANTQDEREQTLNALLVAMDGFQSDTSTTIVVVAATNRPEVLDPALLRPGRFDRQVTILPPNLKGRVSILEVHAQKVHMAPNVNMLGIARSTPGFTGADLANLVNESALMAARKNKPHITMEDIEEAKDKIIMGAQRKGMILNEQEKMVIAYHEAGHALLAKVLPNTDPLHKITIIPRGRALGVTQQIPLDDRHSYSREYLSNRIKILLGGRTAEEIIFNEFSTGASNDLQAATELATRMVCEWGMSQVLGPRAYIKNTGNFLGAEPVQQVFSEDIASAIDSEINKLIEECAQEAMIILEGHIVFLHKLADFLRQEETIDAEDVDIIVTCDKLAAENRGLLHPQKKCGTRHMSAATHLSSLLHLLFC